MGAPIGFVKVYIGHRTLSWPMGEFLRLMRRVPGIRRMITGIGREGLKMVVHIGA